MINNLLIKNKLKFTLKLRTIWIRKNYQFDIYKAINPIFFNFQEFLKLSNLNKILLWNFFYLNIKLNDNNIKNFELDLDFLNKKLICIISHIDNSVTDINFNILSMFFAIYESDINEFKNRNIDISKFYIIYENKQTFTTIFRCTLNLNEKPYDEEFDDIPFINHAKVAIHTKKMTQLLNLFILVDDKSYENLYIECNDSFFEKEYWLFEKFYLFSKNFYLKCIKNRPYEVIINEEKVKSKDIIILNYFINYHKIFIDEKS